MGGAVEVDDEVGERGEEVRWRRIARMHPSLPIMNRLGAFRERILHDFKSRSWSSGSEDSQLITAHGKQREG